MNRRHTTLALALVLLLGACSSDSDGDDAAPTTAADGGTETTAAVEVAGDEDLPSFASDFDRVCTTQTGFPGATPLSGEPGPHPVILFTETDSGVLITSSIDLPAGWGVEEDSDFEDNSELAATELVACAQVESSEPNGTSCDLEGDDGEVVTLDLVDVTYSFTVYEATTGEEVGADTLEAASTDCPTFVFVDEGQTEYLNTPSEDDYINALKPFVET